MKKDATNFVKKCKTCQMDATLNHKHVVALQDMKTPWPFHTWGLDLIDPILLVAKGYMWIITATKYFTKWVEAIPMKKATEAVVSNFIWEFIVSRYGISYKIICGNGTPFVNKHVATMLDGYGIKHKQSTPYYPQGNGQPEATNKTLI